MEIDFGLFLWHFLSPFPSYSAASETGMRYLYSAFLPLQYPWISTLWLAGSARGHSSHCFVSDWLHLDSLDSALHPTSWLHSHCGPGGPRAYTGWGKRSILTKVKLGLRSTIALLEQVDQLAWVGRGAFDEWFPLYKSTSYCTELKMDFSRIKEHLLLVCQYCFSC